MSKITVFVFCLLTGMAQHTITRQQRAAEGMVVAVDRKALSIVISCEAIPGYMDAMEMPFEVQDGSLFDGLHAGVTVRFTMIEDGSHIFAEGIQVVKKLNGEPEPIEAARLEVLHRAINPSSVANVVDVGQRIPDFILNDQELRPIHFSEFKGKVVALTFGYSRCPNPNYCFRLSNNLAQLQRRFSGPKGNDLVLVTILIDPESDRPGVPGTYANAWKSDPARWRVLTGPVDLVRTVAALFGMNFWADESFWTHSFHTAVIDRDGRLVSNLEGNEFTSKQLGDVVESVLSNQNKTGNEKRVSQP